MNSTKSSGYKFYFATDIPGAGKGWILGIAAISRQDARHYLDIQHQWSGRIIGEYDPAGYVPKCDCGAITEKAQEVIIRNNARPIEYKNVF
jgi:hypothetical protein